MTKSRGKNQPKKYWTEAEIAIVRRRYPDEIAQVIADDLGARLNQLYRLAKSLGLAKSDAFKAGPDASRFRRGDHPGKEFQFKPGQVPPNKGKKSPGFAPGKMATTQFKPGVKPINHKPIGAERLATDGYYYRKMTDTGYPPKDWIQIHRLLWIETNGPIPPGYRLAFKDGNRANIVIENLELVSVAEMMRRNTRHNYPKEINELIVLRSQITRQINKREKNEQ